MRHPRSLNAYVRDFNVQMNATPKMAEFVKKLIIVGRIAKMGDIHLLQVPKTSRRHGGKHQDCWEHWSWWSQKEVGWHLTTK